MKTIIIAEAGINHNGNFNLARKLIYNAATCGADFVKFQTYKTSEMIRSNTKAAKYQIKNLKKKHTQYQILEKNLLKKKYYPKLIKFAKKMKIGFISSPFDIQSIKFLIKLKLPFIKIPSGEINNYPYLKLLAKFNKKIILSTGMSGLDEISDAIKILVRYGTKRKNISLLHCHTDYPSKAKNLNLRSIDTLKKKYKLRIGYSDHSLGIEAPIASIVLGARIIEKHLTLNKKMKGPDHKASLEPKEFKLMVRAIRNTEKMIGKGIKTPSKVEKINKIFVRKSLVAKKKINKGEKFSENNLTTKRPATGISPMKYELYLKKRAKKNYLEDDFI